MIHACVRRAADTFACEACSFVGTLRDAIAHVVANQYRVK